MRKGLEKKYKFELDDAKPYIIAMLLTFHILPMIVSFFGETGQMILTNFFMMTLNPIFMFAICCFYGVRNGFEWKFPALAGLIASVSVMLYYSYENVYYLVGTSVIYVIVYMIFAYAFTFVGSFIKRFI